MKNVAELDYSADATLAIIVGFYLIMFTLVEVPIVGFLVAPERTRTAATAFNIWLGRNLRLVAVAALATLGTFEIVRGTIAAFG
jgi:hypothetical protein